MEAERSARAASTTSRTERLELRGRETRRRRLGNASSIRPLQPTVLLATSASALEESSDRSRLRARSPEDGPFDDDLGPNDLARDNARVSRGGVVGEGGRGQADVVRG